MSKEDCIFCRIVAGEVPAEKFKETDEFLFFADHAPKARVHVLGIPKEHWESLNDVPEGSAGVLGRIVEAARDVSREAGIAESGWRLITNIGSDSGQEVKHLHFHVLGGEPLGRMICK
jgi:histidine triad (HIT) family protein